MRAQLWTGAGFELSDAVGIRDPRPGEVTVEIAATGLCHSDLNPVHGRFRQRVPAVLGHEAVGRVVAVGAGSEHLDGKRVVLSPLLSCGECRNCRRGTPTICTATFARRETPFEIAGEPVHQFVGLGTFAERTVVDARQVVPIGDEVPDAQAALLGCAVITGVGAVGRAAVVEGDAVLVVGAGGIGLNAVQEARRRGAERIVVCDRLASKEAIARRMGATEFVVTASADEIVEAARAHLPSGADAAVECTGRPDVLEACAGALAPGGRVVIVGLPGVDETFTMRVRGLFADQAVLGCRMGSVDPHTTIPWLAELVVGGDLVLEPLVTKVVDLGDLVELIDDLEHGRLDRGVMTLR